MAIVYPTAVKAARMQALLDEIDNNGSPAYIEIGSAGMATVLATFVLSDPSGSVTGGALTFTMPKSDISADNTGIAAEAQIMDGGGVAKVTGLTVGTAATDVILDSVNITAGQTVTLNTGVINHA